jgi:hypothetical protein
MNLRGTHYRALTAPPGRPVAFWSCGGCGIWICDEWGPAVPYGAVDHGDGTENHGYGRVKNNLDAIAQIPEVQGWPELRRFLEFLNAQQSPKNSGGLWVLRC